MSLYNLKKWLAKLFSGKEKTIDFSVGDIFYTQQDNKYQLYKLLAMEAEVDCYHILIYSPLDRLPTDVTVGRLSIFVYHAPFSKKAFINPTLLTNQPVTHNDLKGYHEYLRQTRTPSYCLSIASHYYNSGLALTNEKKPHEAIEAYSKAIDLMPQFFEAIDNRAFCKMDLGLWPEAIDDFKLSLQQNPNTLLAEFSIGECYFNMGDFPNAKQKFELAHGIDPNNELPIQFLEKVNKALHR